MQDKKIVETPDGLPWVIRRVSPIEILVAMNPYWADWKRKDVDDGYIFYKKGQDEAYFLSRKEASQTLSRLSRGLHEWLESLDPVEREFFLGLERLRKVEQKLDMPFWKELRGSDPELHSTLVRAVMQERKNQGEIEEVEDELGGQSLSWKQLKSIRTIDERLLALAKVRDKSVHEAKQHRNRKTNNLRSHEKAIQYLLSDESLIEGDLKRRLSRELEEIRSNTSPTGGESRQDVFVTNAFKKMAGENVRLLTQKITPRFRRSALWNAVIVGVVDELISKGLSKRKSFRLTDKILKILCPRFWPNEAEASPDHVRQRYYYWSKKLGK